MANVLHYLGFVPGAQSVEPFEYVTEHPPKRRHTKASYLGRREIDARIAPHVEDLRAGAPDAWVAKRTGLTINQVKTARHRLDIKRGPGRQPTWRRWLAVGRLGASPRVMRTDSPVGGRWELPEYVVRRPLSYRGLVRVVGAAADIGMSSGAIAAALGLRVQDIEAARKLGGRL